jgi:hypothetical protein
MSNKQSLAHDAKREERERGLAFRQDQLSQFYGPVLACMEELEESWQLLFDADKNVENYLKTHKDKHPTAGAFIDKQNAVIEYKQYLYTREVAVFSKIKEIFISHYGLAEPSTRENYRAVVRFIENRNIINVTERKLDITFTGEDTSGLRNRIAALFRNLIDINEQIRNQLESGEPKPIVQLNPERSAVLAATNTPEQLPFPQAIESFEPAKVASESKPNAVQPIAQSVATMQRKNLTGRQNWPGRYTLLANKATFATPAAGAPPSANEESSPKLFD